MKVKITSKNHKIRKSLDRINESNDNKFFDPNIDTIIVDELDLGNGRYGKTDDVNLSESEVQAIFENQQPPKRKYADIEEYRKHAAAYEAMFKDDEKANTVISGEIDPYFKYTDEPGDKNEILNRPDLQVIEPNQRFNHVLRHLPLSVIRKEIFKAWSGIPSSLIADFGDYDVNDDIKSPPSEVIDHGGYHMSFVGGLGPVTTPVGLDKKTKEVLGNFADTFIYTGKLGDIKNNPNIIMVKTHGEGGKPVFKTVNLKPIKAYVEQAVKLIAKMAPHLNAILTKLQVFFVTNVPTMATDGFRLFINPAFVHTLYIKGNHEGVLYVLVHELYHNFLLHHSRHMIRIDEFPNHQMANIAQDIEINHLIEETFPILKGQTEKQGGCWDPDCVNMTWEEIYKEKEVMNKLLQEHQMKEVEDIEIPDSDEEDDGGDFGLPDNEDMPDMEGDPGDMDGKGGQQGGGGGGGSADNSDPSDSGQITEEDVRKIIDALNKTGNVNLVNKLTRGASNFLVASPMQKLSFLQHYSIPLTTAEIQTIAEVMRSVNEEGIAKKIEGLLQDNSDGDDSEGGEGGGSGGSGSGSGSGSGGGSDSDGEDGPFTHDNTDGENADGEMGDGETQSGQDGQDGEVQGTSSGGKGEEEPYAHLSDEQKKGMSGRDAEQIQQEIDELRSSGQEAEANQLERMRAQAEQDFDKSQKGGGSRQMSAQEILDELERLEAAGQKESADNIRKQIADAFNEAKRKKSKENGTYDEGQEQLTDMKPSEVDDMLRKGGGFGPATKQEGYDGSDKHTDHQDMISPEQGDKILENSKQKHEERNQNVLDKQMDDYKDLKDIYDNNMGSKLGQTMGNILAQLTAALKPAVNWKQRLSVFLKSNITPEGRKAWNKSALVRGVYNRRRRDTRDSGEAILALIDVSGSVYGSGDNTNKTLIQFISELCSMATSLNVNYIHVLPFSGDVDYKGLQSLDQKKMRKYASNPKRFKIELEGSGATNFVAAVNSLRDNRVKRLKPDAVIIFTDGGDTGQENEIPPLPRLVQKKAVLWFLTPMSNGEWSNPDFKPPYGQLIKVMPGKGVINESSKYAHRNEIRKERAMRVYEERMKENPMYQYIHEGKFYNPAEFSPLEVERIPLNRVEAYDKGLVKTSNEAINNRIKLYRVCKDFQKLAESVQEREEYGDKIYNKINESKDVTVDDIQEAIRRSQKLQNE